MGVYGDTRVAQGGTSFPQLGTVGMRGDPRILRFHQNGEVTIQFVIPAKWPVASVTDAMQTLALKPKPKPKPCKSCGTCNGCVKLAKVFQYKFPGVWWLKNTSWETRKAAIKEQDLRCNGP